MLSVLLTFVLLQDSDPRASQELLETVPDGRTLLRRCPKPGRSALWSPDAKSVAFVVAEGRKHRGVVVQELQDKFTWVNILGMTVDGRCVWVGANFSKTREKSTLFFDDKVKMKTGRIEHFAMNPDGSIMAFWAFQEAKIRPDGSVQTKDGRLCVGKQTKDGWSIERSPSYDRVAELPPLIAENRVLAFGIRGRGAHVLLQEGKRFRAAKEPLGHWPLSASMAANGKRVALWSSKSILLFGVDGNPRGTLLKAQRRVTGDTAKIASPVLSPDGDHVAYKALEGSKMGIVLDEEEPRFNHDSVLSPVFDENGERMAFVSVEGVPAVDPSSFYGWWEDNLQEGKWRLIVRHIGDDKEHAEPETYDEIRDLTFAPDGAIAFRARLGERWHVAHGDWRSPAYDEVGRPRFPEGGKVVFGARKGDDFYRCERNK